MCVFPRDIQEPDGSRHISHVELLSRYGAKLYPDQVLARRSHGSEVDDLSRDRTCAHRVEHLVDFV